MSGIVFKNSYTVIIFVVALADEPSVPTYFFYLLFYFICHTKFTKNIGKEEKKKWRGDLTETIGAYERLGLLETMS